MLVGLISVAVTMKATKVCDILLLRFPQRSDPSYDKAMTGMNWRGRLPNVSYLDYV